MLIRDSYGRSDCSSWLAAESVPSRPPNERRGARFARYSDARLWNWRWYQPIFFASDGKRDTIYLFRARAVGRNEA